jgi:hypothetical protein
MTSKRHTDAAVRLFRTEHLVLALTSVNGSTVACATHGDVATLEVLIDYYELVATAADGAGGRDNPLACIRRPVSYGSQSRRGRSGQRSLRPS